MNNYYNVMDYGALGNGVANDTLAIQLAINTAQSDGGGRVYFPPRRFLTGNLIIPLGITLYGAGALVSTLVASQTTGDILDVMGPGVRIHDLGFDTSVPRSGGSYVHLTDACYQCYLDHFSMEKAFMGVHLSSAALTCVEYGSIRNLNPLLGSCGVLIDDGNDQFLRCLEMDNEADKQPQAGIWVQNTGCLNITDCDIIHCGNDLLITGGYSIYAVNSFFDTALCGVRILAQNPVARCHFLGCWTSSHSEHGFLIEPSSTVVEDILIQGHQSFFNKLSGIYLGAGSHLNVNSCQARHNGNYGCYVAPPTRYTQISNNDFTDNALASSFHGIAQIVMNNFN